VNSRTRIFERPQTGRVLGLINPIENSPECYNAACHAHPPDQSVLGVLDVTMSMAEPDHHLATVKRQTVIAAVLVAVLASLFSAAFIFRVVRRPIKQLIIGTELVAAGDLSTEITIDRRNEIGQLAGAFNTMTRDLARAQIELQEWSNGLETKLQEKTAELSQTQRQVAHMDKMASLGKLAASVAHELNNPLAGILNYAKLVDRTLRESDTSIPDREHLERYLSLIQKEASRSGNIVRNLLIFARPVGAEFANHSINAIVESAVMLLKHHLAISEIRLETQPLDGDDQLRCDADQLQQALVALLVNAVEAMPNGGTLRVSAERADGSVMLSIVDTGIGIPKEVMPHILEPFFSSKEQEGAVGLGLSVAYGIVQHHQGHIEVDSEVGRGTTFRIILPLHPPTKKNPTVDALTDNVGELSPRPVVPGRPE
jgi:two-component system NtrC family sensor kinase